jgi:hypothetical protein
MQAVSKSLRRKGSRYVHNNMYTYVSPISRRADEVFSCAALDIRAKRLRGEMYWRRGVCVRRLIDGRDGWIDLNATMTDDDGRRLAHPTLLVSFGVLIFVSLFCPPSNHLRYQLPPHPPHHRQASYSTVPYCVLDYSPCSLGTCTESLIRCIPRSVQ